MDAQVFASGVDGQLKPIETSVTLGKGVGLLIVGGDNQELREIAPVRFQFPIH